MSMNSYLKKLDLVWIERILGCLMRFEEARLSRIGILSRKFTVAINLVSGRASLAMGVVCILANLGASNGISRGRGRRRSRVLEMDDLSYGARFESISVRSTCTRWVFGPRVP